MSLLKLSTALWNNKDEYLLEHLQVLLEDFNGMDALNPFLNAMTPNKGWWLPLVKRKEYYESIAPKFSFRIWHLYKFPRW